MVIGSSIQVLLMEEGQTDIDLISCTFAIVNLAVALAMECRLRVGLLDADVYGPSIPNLMKLEGRPELDSGTYTSPVLLWGMLNLCACFYVCVMPLVGHNF